MSLGSKSFKHRQRLRGARSGDGSASAEAVCSCGYRQDLSAPDLTALHRNAARLHDEHNAACEANERAGLIPPGTGGAGTIDGLAGSHWVPPTATDETPTPPRSQRARIARRVAVGVIIVVGLGGVTFMLLRTTEPPIPTVGDCVAIDEENEIRTVDCDSGEVGFHVVSRVDDSTSVLACAGEPLADVTYRLLIGDDRHVVLCLDEE
jgi:hypothetical protein